MVLQTSGSISLSNVMYECGLPYNSSASMSMFYLNSPSISDPVNTSIPISGQIKMSQMYGARHGAPINLAVNSNANPPLLSWQTSCNALGPLTDYVVTYNQTTSAIFSNVFLKTTNATSTITCPLSNLAPGTSYDVCVQSVNSNVVSSRATPTMTFKTASAAINLTVSTPSSGNVNLTWSIDPVILSSVSYFTVVLDATSKTVSPLNAGTAAIPIFSTTYISLTSGTHTWSVMVTFTSGNTSSNVAGPVINIPYTPFNLIATIPVQGSGDLTWNDSNVLGVIQGFSKMIDAVVTVAMVPFSGQPTNPLFKSTYLNLNGGTHTWSVQTMLSSAASSATIAGPSIIVPYAPYNLTVTASSPDSGALSWKDSNAFTSIQNFAVAVDAISTTIPVTYTGPISNPTYNTTYTALAVGTHPWSVKTLLTTTAASSLAYGSNIVVANLPVGAPLSIMTNGVSIYKGGTIAWLPCIASSTNCAATYYILQYGSALPYISRTISAPATSYTLSSGEVANGTTVSIIVTAYGANGTTAAGYGTVDINTVFDVSVSYPANSLTSTTACLTFCTNVPQPPPPPESYYMEVSLFDPPYTAVVSFPAAYNIFTLAGVVPVRYLRNSTEAIVLVPPYPHVQLVPNTKYVLKVWPRKVSFISGGTYYYDDTFYKSKAAGCFFTTLP
jgi:Fibronectin type III domain